PCLTQPQLRIWESANGVTLPEEYRRFLTDVGDGGMMPGSYCNFVVESLAGLRFGPGVAAPFPVTATRLRDRMRRLEVEGRPADGVLFPELEPFWQEEEEEDEAQPPAGCVFFGRYPSYDPLFLVTAGDLRGSVWCLVGHAVPEVDRSG